jgi:hypothetical protein
MSTAVATPKRETIVVSDPVHVLDTARFEHMMRVANVMASSSLLPESLTTIGSKNNKESLPHEKVLANAFLIVNLAVRWQADPFAISQAVSIVRGKLCVEGKLVHAILESRLGIDLEYIVVKDKDGFGSSIIVSGVKNGRMLKIEGSVTDWTTGGDGAWGNKKAHERMLRYRGAREWARAYAPAIILGVYGDDELSELADNARASRARVVENPLDDAPLKLAQPTEKVDAETGEITPIKATVEMRVVDTRPLDNAPAAAEPRERTSASTSTSGSVTTASPSDFPGDKPVTRSVAASTDKASGEASPELTPDAGSREQSLKDVAWYKGFVAGKEGRSTRSMPAEYADFDELRDAWTEGHTSGLVARDEAGAA